MTFLPIMISGNHKNIPLIALGCIQLTFNYVFRGFPVFVIFRWHPFWIDVVTEENHGTLSLHL